MLQRGVVGAKSRVRSGPAKRKSKISCQKELCCRELPIYCTAGQAMSVSVTKPIAIGDLDRALGRLIYKAFGS